MSFIYFFMGDMDQSSYPQIFIENWTGPRFFMI
jgi:hypothetical protein